jgi:RND superfamily putative drug exporter
VCWVVVAILGALAALGLPSLLTTSLTVPGTSSAQANAILVKDFHENIEGTFTVVVPLAGATAGPALGLIESALLDAVEAVPTASITQEHVVEGVLYANVDTTLDLGQAAKETPFLRHELSVQGVTGALVTGPPALQSDITPILANDLHRGEVLAVVLALALLVAVLGLCWALVIPYLVAAATTAGTLGVVFLLAHWVTMVLYVPNVIELIGLALAIDYSLLIVHRFRAEVAKPVQLEEAILRTMGSAGRTILISGCAVAIGLATLFIVPVPFVRSLGAAGLVVPVFSLLAAFTLQPVLLCYFAERGVSPVVLRGLMARRAPSDGTWARIGRGVTLHPARVLVLSLLVLAFVSSLAFGLELTPGSVTAIPQGMQSAKALNLVRDHVGPGAVTPIQVIIDTGSKGGAKSLVQSKTRLTLAGDILQNPEAFVVAIGGTAPYVDPSGRYEQIIVLGRDDFGAEASQQFVEELTHHILPSVHLPQGTSVYVGGAPAQGVDFLNTVYGTFPWLVLLALALAWLVLVRAFRSVLLALLAVLLDLVSVCVAYGVLVAVFRLGVLSSVLGTYQVSQIEGWVPVFLFAMLFGLSMDYEVFIVSRIRESHAQGASTNVAIVDGLAHTGGVVTSAALIMVVALSGLVFGHVAGLQELGVGLSFGVLVDATIVRGLVLPSAMTLLGRWNWWLPTLLASPLRVTASPLRGTRQ